MGKYYERSAVFNQLLSKIMFRVGQLYIRFTVYFRSVWIW